MRSFWLKFLILLMVLLLSIACTSLRTSIHSPAEWMEGKDYLVSIRFYRAKPELLSSVTIHYQHTTAAVISKPLLKMGDEYRLTLPGKELKPGTLVYYISYYYKDKEANTASQKVQILSYAQAKQKYLEDLYARLVHLPPTEVPIVEDLSLSLHVRNHKPSTQVSFYIKPEKQGAVPVANPLTYREEMLMGQNGLFSYRIPASLLEQGFNTYYFKIEEIHEDFGDIELFYPRQGQQSPLTYTLLNTKDVLLRMTRELAQAVQHSAPQEAFIEKDLKLDINLRYPKDSFLARFTDNKATASFYYKKPSAAAFTKVELVNTTQFFDSCRFSAFIPSASLKSGHNQYYFKLIDYTRLGEVSAIYPLQGDKLPLTFRLLTVEELRARKGAELYARLAHTPPLTPVEGITDLSLALTVRGANSSTIAFLNYKTPTQLKYSSKLMTRMNETFVAALTSQEQQTGYNQYYFTIQEEDVDVGQVKTSYRQNGEMTPFGYQLVDINLVKARLLADLAERTQHILVKEALEGEDLVIQATIREVKPGTEIFLYYKKQTDKSYRLSPFTQPAPSAHQASIYTARIPKEDIQSGHNQYYLQVKEQHQHLGSIALDVPTNGAALPFTFIIHKLQDVIIRGIQFKHLEQVNEGKPVNVRLFFQHWPGTGKVILKYRVTGDTSTYFSVEMNRQGNHFESDISEAFLKAGNQLDYYFEIQLPEEKLTFKYPDESILPLSFKVLAKDEAKKDDKKQP